VTFLILIGLVFAAYVMDLAFDAGYPHVTVFLLAAAGAILPWSVEPVLQPWAVASAAGLWSLATALLGLLDREVRGSFLIATGAVGLVATNAWLQHQLELRRAERASRQRETELESLAERRHQELIQRLNGAVLPQHPRRSRTPETIMVTAAAAAMIVALRRRQ
jgi:hypothetical protein